MTDTLGGPFCLAVAAFSAPLVAVDPAEPAVLHAATMEAIVDGWGHGLGSVRLPASRMQAVRHRRRERPVAAPVRRAELGRARCVACHKATGRRRPRCTIARVPSEAETILRWGTA